MEWGMTTTPKLFIVYCSIAGFISAWAISGLLVIIDMISGTPVGTFFGVIGTSLGLTDPTTAQYIGFALHVLTGMAAGNIFGQFALFWHKVTPYNSRSAPNQYIYNEANHFQGLYSVIIGGSFVFHIVYGALMGFISGRMAELRVFAKLKATAANNSLQ